MRKCPNCSFEQSEDLPDCGRCGIFFDKWRERETRRSQDVPERASAPRQEGVLLPKLVGLGMKLLLATAGILIIWFVLCPSSLPILPGSRVDQDRGYAVKIPEGWAVTSSEERFSGDFATVLTFERPGSDPEVPLRGGVGVASRDLPRLKAGVRLDWSPFVAAALPGAMDSYQIESVRSEEMDRLRAIRVDGPGVRTCRTTETVEVPAPRSPSSRGRPAPASVTETRVVDRPTQCRFRMQASQGAYATYIIAVAGSEADLSSRSPEVRAIINSFRVFDRRYSVRHIYSALRGELLEEFIILILVSVWAFYRWMLSGALDE